jgi:uncharacterized protein YdeI (YjbR/CyaY-like superfamily)
MSEPNPKADFFFAQEKRWPNEIALLRTILLGLPLTEQVKWGCPCYTVGSNNIVLIHTFKDYCALLLFKGVLLKDPQKLLVQQTSNVQSARQLRFTSTAEIAKQQATIAAYVRDAIAVEKAGLKVARKPTEEFDMPVEFKARLAKDTALQEAFTALTPGRQRAYLLHFSSAKHAATREARIDKYSPVILAGKGLND